MGAGTCEGGLKFCAPRAITLNYEMFLSALRWARGGKSGAPLGMAMADSTLFLLLTVTTEQQ